MRYLELSFLVALQIGTLSCGQGDELLVRFLSERMIPAETDKLEVAVFSLPSGEEIQRQHYPLKSSMSFPVTLVVSRGSTTPVGVRIEGRLRLGPSNRFVAAGGVEVEFLSDRTRQVDVTLVDTPVAAQ